jgi:pantetheine-phosphate adenylyltransferase
MSCINKKLDNDIETIFLAAIEENQFISSTFVKEVAALGGDIKKFLPKEIAELLLKKMLLLNN